MNRFLKNQWKKVIAAAMLGVMLCGNAVVSVHAATNGDEHVCEENMTIINNKYVTGSSVTGTHQYEGGTCYLVTVRYVQVQRCDICGATRYVNPWTRTLHENCGQGWVN